MTFDAAASDDGVVSDPHPLASADLDPLDLSPLSEREREILSAAVAGLPAREIASRFTLSEATVRSHLASIYSKLGVTGRVELLARLHGAAPSLDAVPTSDPGQPDGSLAPDRRSRRRPFLILAAAVVVTAALAIVTVATAQFIALRPDLPPRSDLATVSALVAAGGVTELSQAAELNRDGGTLTVTLMGGGRLRVDGVTYAEFQSLAEAAASNLERTDPGRYLSISNGGNSELTQLGILATVYLPTIPFVVVAVLALRVGLRRRAALRPAA